MLHSQTPPPVALHRTSVDVLAEAFRVQNPLMRAGLNLLMRSPGHDLACTALQFDALVAEHHTMREASRWLLANWTQSVTVMGEACVPASGPLVIVSNHPGLVDAMALLAHLPRTDVRPIAKTRNLLHELHHVREYIITHREDSALTTMRNALGHLHNGGAVLTFPRGAIEPDPALHPGPAADSVNGWSHSLDILTRRVPHLTVIPAAVSGVISPRAYHSLFARAYRNPDARAYIAATLQIMLARYRDTHVRVSFGPPMHAASTAAVHEAVRRQLANLNASH